ncbi:MAG: biopolymer transporter ExbD [Pseudomonadota bacterium]
MKVNVPWGNKARIEMIPLIDTVFLLLVFFIYAMLSMAVHRGLPVTLPTSSTAGIDRHSILSLTVNADGSISLDKERVMLKDLMKELKARTAKREETGVLLFADRNLSYQNLFKVLDQIRLSGLTRISLQAEAGE